MHTQPTTHVHRPTVFDGGDLSWVATALAPLAEAMGADAPWGITLDVYADQQGNFYPILDEPNLFVAGNHPLHADTQGCGCLTELKGALRLAALETLVHLVQSGTDIIELMEHRTYALRAEHDVESHTRCYWRLVLSPNGCVAVIPEYTDGYVKRNTTLGFHLGSPHWDAQETIGLGTLATEGPRSAHEVLATAGTTRDAAAWYAALCSEMYLGEAKGLVWGEPANTLPCN